MDGTGTTTCSWFATIHLEATKLLVDVVREQGQRAHVGKVGAFFFQFHRLSFDGPASSTPFRHRTRKNKIQNGLPERKRVPHSQNHILPVRPLSFSF
jgi:hypothetical protein